MSTNVSLTGHNQRAQRGEHVVARGAEVRFAPFDTGPRRPTAMEYLMRERAARAASIAAQQRFFGARP